MTNLTPGSNSMDRFGYFKVGDLKFYSRLEAYEVSNRLNVKPVTWHFNDEVFSSYDWTVEPIESLEELYRQRAQDIRDKYDYVVLHFSGGADSANILNTFLDNDIRIDELVSLVNYEGTKDKTNFMNGEIFHVAIPEAEYAKEKQPHIKHNVIDVMSNVERLFKESSTKFDWMYEQNTFVGMTSVSNKFLKDSQKHWRDLVAQGKKICFIFGIDKPAVTGTDEKGYYLYFHDMIDTGVSPAMQIANEEGKGYFTEYFYWSPEPAAVKLLIKQGHVMKRVLKTIDIYSDWVSIGARSSRVSSARDKKMFWLKLNAVNREVYPKWKKVLWQVKPKSFVLSSRDDFYHKLGDHDADKRWWKQGVEHMWAVMPKEMRKVSDDMYMGYTTLSSKRYFLGY